MTAEHEAILSSFLEEERASGRRPRGVDVLRKVTRRFVRFMEGQGKKLDELKLSDAYEYQGSLISDGRTREGTPLTMGTISSLVCGASVLGAYLERAGRILDNPFEHLRRVRVERTIPDGILKEREMAALLDVLKVRDYSKGMMNAKRRYMVHVIAELQYASGLRIAEVAGLTADDVDVERALVYVKGGKHGSNRTAFLTDYAACVLELYIERARPLLVTRGNMRRPERLFFATYKNLTGFVNLELAAACREANVNVITSHGFRHALGYHLLRSGCSLRYIQAILGHRFIGETEVYTKVDEDDAKRVFDECHPRFHTGTCVT